MMEPFVSPPMISCSVRKAGCLRERERQFCKQHLFWRNFLGELNSAVIAAIIAQLPSLFCGQLLEMAVFLFRYFQFWAALSRVFSSTALQLSPLILSTTMAMSQSSSPLLHPTHHHSARGLLPGSYRVRALLPGSTQTIRTTHSTKSPWSRRLKFGGQVTVCSAARTSAS